MSASPKVRKSEVPVFRKLHLYLKSEVPVFRKSHLYLKSEVPILRKKSHDRNSEKNIFSYILRTVSWILMRFFLRFYNFKTHAMTKIASKSINVFSRYKSKSEKSIFSYILERVDRFWCNFFLWFNNFKTNAMKKIAPNSINAFSRYKRIDFVRTYGHAIFFGLSGQILFSLFCWKPPILLPNKSY